MHGSRSFWCLLTWRKLKFGGQTTHSTNSIRLKLPFCLPSGSISSLFGSFLEEICSKLARMNGEVRRRALRAGLNDIPNMEVTWQVLFARGVGGVAKNNFTSTRGLFINALPEINYEIQPSTTSLCYPRHWCGCFLLSRPPSSPLDVWRTKKHENCSRTVAWYCNQLSYLKMAAFILEDE